MSRQVWFFALSLLALSAASAPQAAEALCYAKSDGGASAFDLIDTRHTGSIALDGWKTYYGQRYAALTPERRKKTTLERYLKYAGARFKGLDKDRNGAVTCAEYKASIERMKARRIAKAAAAKANPPPLKTPVAKPTKPKGR